MLLTYTSSCREIPQDPLHVDSKKTKQSHRYRRRDWELPEVGAWGWAEWVKDFKRYKLPGI